MIEQMIGRLAVVGMLLAAASTTCADESQREFEPPTYKIQRAGTAMTIDGRLDEPAWVAAPHAGLFHFPWFNEGEREQTVVKMLWDDQFMYIAHICQDAHITARHAKHDDPVAEDDCFEVMIVPDLERADSYYNIEWNVRGAYVDGSRPEGPQGSRPPWDVRGLRFAGSHVGTLNDDADLDIYWICEVAIPLENFAEGMPHAPPEPGDQWRLNLSRHGGDVNMQYSQWSPADTPTPSFHTPHRFGQVVFSAKTSPFAIAGDEGRPNRKAP